MIINTKAHPNKSVYKKQFEELLNVDKQSFGIISKIKTDTKGSPLWCDIVSLQASVAISSFPSYYTSQDESFNPTIHIVSTTLDDNGKPYELYVGFRDNGKDNFFKFDYFYDDMSLDKTKICTGNIQEDSELFSDIVSISLSSETYPSFTEVSSPNEIIGEGLFYCDKVNGILKFCGKNLEQVTINYVIKVGNLQETISSLNSAFSTANESGLGIKAVIRDNFVIVTGINETFGITSSSSYLRIDCFSRIYVNAGSAILPSGNKVTLDKDVILNFESQDISGKVLFIILSTEFETTSTGLDEFSEEQDKTIGIKDGSKCISVSEYFDENKDNICLAVFKPFSINDNEYTSDVIEIDSIKEKFAFLRPWYSPFDVKHRNLLGTGKKTHNNPHAISFNDIDSENTLHNKLLSRGLVLSKPNERQDTCGELKEYTISKTEVRYDSDKSLFGVCAYNNSYDEYKEETYFAYFVLPEIPISICYIEDTEGNPLNYYEWVEHTSVIKVNLDDNTVIKDFKIGYYSESTLEPYISNEGNGVELKRKRKNCVVFSEGKDVTNINDLVSFSDVENLEKNYDVYVDKNGSFVKVPSLEVSSDIELIDGELTSLFARSRLEVTLTNIPNKPKLDCPVTLKGDGTVTEEVEIYQSFGLYTTDYYGRKILTYESMVCPNPFVPEVDEENGTDSLRIICEKSNQTLVDFYSMNKKNFKVDSDNYLFKFNNREDRYIYNGITISIEVIVTENIDDISERIHLTIRHNDENDTRELELYPNSDTSTRLSKGRAVSISTDVFNGMNSYGEWEIDFNRMHSNLSFFVKNISIKLNYGIIEPILYAKQKDNYVKLKMVANEDGSYTVNPFYGTSYKAKDNEDFKVVVDIVGNVNGENLTESIEFDSKFRNQQGLNSKTSENVFDEVTKYSISETSTTGKVTILAYPVGNINNLCGVFSCNYKNLKISKLYDIRKVCPNILFEEKSILGLTPVFVKSMCDVLYRERIEAYFEFMNISEDGSSINNITLYSSTEFKATIIDDEGHEYVNRSTYNYDLDTYVIFISSIDYGYRVKTENQSVSSDLPYGCIRVTNQQDNLSLEITHWDSSWTTLERMFNGLKILTKIPNTWEGCYNVTSMERAFNDCRRLKRIPNFWNGLEKVKSMEHAFDSCNSLENIANNFTPLKNVITMDYCFEDCYSLVIDELSFDKLYSLEGLYHTFRNCKKINKITSWKGLTKITDISETFENTGIEVLPESWEGLENITTANDTFIGCDFSELPSSWEGLTSLNFGSSMFSDCKNLKSIPKYWYGLENLENASNMFKGCHSLEKIPVNYKGLENVQYTNSMFENCLVLSEIPNTFVGLENDTYTSRMFYNCESIVTEIKDFLGLSKVYDASSMFENCLSIVSVNSWNGFDRLQNANSIFKNSGLYTIPYTFIGLGTELETDDRIDLSSAFEDCKRLSTTINSFINLSKVSDVSCMLKNCTSITNIPKSWNGLENVTSLEEFCSGCINLEKIPDSWEYLDSVTSIRRIFYECSSVITGGEQYVESLTHLNNCEEAFYGMSSWTADADDIYRRLNNLPTA